MHTFIWFYHAFFAKRKQKTFIVKLVKFYVNQTWYYAAGPNLKLNLLTRNVTT